VRIATGGNGPDMAQQWPPWMIAIPSIGVNPSMLLRVIALASAFALLGASAQAAEELSPALLAYIATPEHRAAVMSAVRPYFAFIPSCATGVAKRIALRVTSPVSFDATGALSSGSWIEGVKVEGCTTSGLFNVLTMARDGAPPRVGGLLPGVTRAAFELQRDALPTARSFAASKIPGGCGELHVIDTSFEGFGAAGNPDLPAESWRERWTFSGCGQQTTVTMRFTPDQTGTSFIAGS
jgi:hypothetical protein